MHDTGIFRTRALLLTAALLVGALAYTATDARAGESVDPHGGMRKEADALLGEWWTEDRQGRVRFVRHEDGTYKGITTWRAPAPSTPDNPAIDIHNPNPEKRNRSTTGIVLIWNLTYEDGEYNDGYVYNPRNGNTYRFKAKVLDHDRLKIRGFWGIRLLGANQIWRRYEPDA